MGEKKPLQTSEASYYCKINTQQKIATHHKKDSTTSILGWMFIDFWTKTLVKKKTILPRFKKPLRFWDIHFLGGSNCWCGRNSGVSKLRNCWIHLPERSCQGPIEMPTKKNPKTSANKNRVFRTWIGVEFVQSHGGGPKQKTKNSLKHRLQKTSLIWKWG